MNVDKSNNSDEICKDDHDINTVPHFDEYNPKAQSSDLVTCFGLPECNKRDNCDCSDQAQELIRVKSQIAALQNQSDSLNRVINSMNVVVESISRIVVPDEGSDLHPVIRLRKMRMEFSSILESKNKVLDDREDIYMLRIRQAIHQLMLIVLVNHTITHGEFANDLKVEKQRAKTQ